MTKEEHFLFSRATLIQGLIPKKWIGKKNPSIVI
jgi:hypothetical protein